METKTLADAVNSASGGMRATWLSLLSLVAYLFIAVGAVTHPELLLETPKQLPILNVPMPLTLFFVAAPFLVLIVHGYYLVQLSITATRLKRLFTQLFPQGQASDPEAVAQASAMLDSAVVLQYLAPWDLSSRPLRWMLAVAVIVTSILILSLIHI